jgi:hypothetical protein
MSDSKLDDLLARLGRRDPSSLPGSFSQDVLREIRLRKSERADTLPPWRAGLIQFWLRPQSFALAVTAAVMIGAMLPLAWQTDDTAQIIEGLDLNVFSSSAPNAPSGLLAKWP